MRTILTIIVVCTLAALPLAVFAAPVSGGTAIEITDVERLVEEVVQFFITIAALAVVGYLIYGGMKIAMAQGNDAEVKKGKDIVKNAVIGAAVIFGVGVIVNTIANFAADPTTIDGGSNNGGGGGGDVRIAPF
jgi:prepilin signal peptidase PulO-like enzyme (type II secretory pathway)